MSWSDCTAPFVVRIAERAALEEIDLPPARTRPGVPPSARRERIPAGLRLRLQLTDLLERAAAGADLIRGASTVAGLDDEREVQILLDALAGALVAVLRDVPGAPPDPAAPDGGE